MKRNRPTQRRGVTAAQWLIMIALIMVVILGTLRTLGINARTNLNTTSGNIADPSTLPARFGS